ncbi:MAG TPA: cell wall anchor protein, partial [Chitinophagaceae bacterium]|nr:cell wall anchor protein [Chitinophagaceae bacterium]
GKAHVRFVHLSPDAPAVDVAVTGGSVVFANKAFKTYTAFTPLDAGTYNLEVRVAGTSTVALPLPGIALTAGKIYTVFAKGFLGGTGAQALGAQIIVNN